jgi:hypothetical protein
MMHTMTHTDRFWKFFWTTAAAVLLVFIVTIAVLTYLRNPLRVADISALGVVFDPSHDPFARAAQERQRPAFTSDYLYRDSLPLSFDDWSWGTTVDWNSGEQTYEGAHSFKVTYLVPWAGVRAAGSDFELGDYNGISLAVYPDGNVGDVYIELYDTFGHSFGRQSVGSYAPEGNLTPRTWNVVYIPVANLMHEGAGKQKITGFSLGTEHLGTIYIDAVHLVKDVPPHGRWSEPVATEAPSAPPVDLPYTLTFTPEGVAPWDNIFGRFDLTSDGVYVGPVAQKTTGSMSYLPGARDWEDYRVDTGFYWGPAESLSILVRFADDGNFVACSYGFYGAQVQITRVLHGDSTLIGASPRLPVRANEAWKDAQHGVIVRGDTVSCLQDGIVVLSATLPSMSANGGVGLETWTRNTEDRPHRLQSLTVSAL